MHPNWVKLGRVVDALETAEDVFFVVDVRCEALTTQQRHEITFSCNSHQLSGTLYIR